MHDVIAASP